MKEFIALLLLLAPAICNAGSGGRFATYSPKNNLMECSKDVQSALAAAKETWGPFDFTCEQGTVLKVYYSTSSAISNGRQIPFVLANPGIFGVDGSTVVIDGGQTYKYIRIANTGVLVDEYFDANRKKHFGLIIARLVNTLGWDVDVSPELDKKPWLKHEALFAQAVKHWRDGRLRDMDGTNHECEIRPDGCGTGKPTLECRVNIWDNELKHPRVSYGVDAATGKRCPDNRLPAERWAP